MLTGGSDNSVDLLVVSVPSIPGELVAQARFSFKDASEDETLYGNDQMNDRQTDWNIGWCQVYRNRRHVARGVAAVVDEEEVCSRN